MEYMDAGALTDYLGQMKEEEMAFVFKEMLAVLSFLHDERRVIHRDIKSDNILLNSRGDVKLCIIF